MALERFISMAVTDRVSRRALKVAKFTRLSLKATFEAESPTKAESPH
jgi:hypothetical protein